MKKASGKSSNCTICRFNNDNRFTLISSSYWIIGSAHDISVKGLYFLRVKRHLEHLGDLTNSEAIEMGGMLKKVSKMSKNESRAKRVITMSLGFSEPHIHFWIVPVTKNTEKDLLKIGKAVRNFVEKNSINS